MTDMQTNNEFFLGLAHDLYPIASLHRTERDAMIRALMANGERRPAQLRLALATMRAAAERIASNAVEIEKKLDAHIGVKP